MQLGDCSGDSKDEEVTSFCLGMMDALIMEEEGRFASMNSPDQHGYYFNMDHAVPEINFSWVTKDCWVGTESQEEP